MKVTNIYDDVTVSSKSNALAILIVNPPKKLFEKSKNENDIWKWFSALENSNLNGLVCLATKCNKNVIRKEIEENSNLRARHYIPLQAKQHTYHATYIFLFRDFDVEYDFFLSSWHYI